MENTAPLVIGFDSHHIWPYFADTKQGMAYLTEFAQAASFAMQRGQSVRFLSTNGLHRYNDPEIIQTVLRDFISFSFEQEKQKQLEALQKEKTTLAHQEKLAQTALEKAHLRLKQLETDATRPSSPDDTAAVNAEQESERSQAEVVKHQTKVEQCSKKLEIFSQPGEIQKQADKHAQAIKSNLEAFVTHHPLTASQPAAPEKDQKKQIKKGKNYFEAHWASFCGKIFFSTISYQEEVKNTPEEMVADADNTWTAEAAIADTRAALGLPPAPEVFLLPLESTASEILNASPLWQTIVQKKFSAKTKERTKALNNALTPFGLTDHVTKMDWFDLANFSSETQALSYQILNRLFATTHLKTMADTYSAKYAVGLYNENLDPVCLESKTEKSLQAHLPTEVTAITSALFVYEEMLSLIMLMLEYGPIEVWYPSQYFGAKDPKASPFCELEALLAEDQIFLKALKQKHPKFANQLDAKTIRPLSFTMPAAVIKQNKAQQSPKISVGTSDVDSPQSLNLLLLNELRALREANQKTNEQLGILQNQVSFLTLALAQQKKPPQKEKIRSFTPPLRSPKSPKITDEPLSRSLPTPSFAHNTLFPPTTPKDEQMEPPKLKETTSIATTIGPGNYSP